MDVYNKLNKYSLLSYGDREFVLRVAQLCNSAALLTPRQSNKLKKILEKAIEDGLIIE